MHLDCYVPSHPAPRPMNHTSAGSWGVKSSISPFHGPAVQTHSRWATPRVLQPLRQNSLDIWFKGGQRLASANSPREWDAVLPAWGKDSRHCQVLPRDAVGCDPSPPETCSRLPVREEDSSSLEGGGLQGRQAGLRVQGSRLRKPVTRTLAREAGEEEFLLKWDTKAPGHSPIAHQTSLTKPKFKDTTTKFRYMALTPKHGASWIWGPVQLPQTMGTALGLWHYPRGWENRRRPRRKIREPRMRKAGGEGKKKSENQAEMNRQKSERGKPRRRWKVEGHWG